METIDDAGKQKNNRSQLTDVLRSNPDAADCEQCLTHLEVYIAAQLAQEDYLDRFPTVAGHLDTCPDCAGAYARLYEVELAAAANLFDSSVSAPAPDLGFLSTEEAELADPSAEMNLEQYLRAALERTGDLLRLTLSTDLLTLLQPSTAPAPTRAPADSTRYADLLLELDPPEMMRDDLPLTVTAYRDSQQPEYCLVEVVVEPPDRSWPDLAGINVTLLIAAERQVATTDAWGLASFENVPIIHLANLSLETTLSPPA